MNHSILMKPDFMISYKEYTQQTGAALKALIDRQIKSEKKTERELQTFFENHPSTLLNVLSGVESQHNIFGDVIISQPKFKSLQGDRNPDFLIVTWNSMQLFYNFIEIEDPSKKIFSGVKQEPSTDFMHAYNQLKQWQTFKEEVDEFCKDLKDTLFHDNFNNTRDKTIHQNFILLYGHSGEFKNLSERHNQVLQGYFNGNLKHCTYSRLVSDMRIDYPLFSVRKDPMQNRWKAIGMVPFTNYDKHAWSELHNVVGKEDVINCCQLLTDKQKEKLISQIQLIDCKSREEINHLFFNELGTTSFEDLEI